MKITESELRQIIKEEFNSNKIIESAEDPHSVVELMHGISLAAQNRDIEQLDRLEMTARGWLQSDEERDAQIELINNVRDILYDLESYGTSDELYDGDKLYDDFEMDL
jgi:hypothetical protein